MTSELLSAHSAVDCLACLVTFQAAGLAVTVDKRVVIRPVVQSVATLAFVTTTALLTSSQVLLASHQLKVCSVDAPPVATQVIEVHSFWDGTELVDPPATVWSIATAVQLRVTDQTA